MTKPTPKDLPIKPFPSPTSFRTWLSKNHATSPGIWLQFFKKNSGQKSITYPEALDIALCFGWIDGQIKKHDPLTQPDSWIHKFTPRRPRSNWSKRNTQHAERLIADGLMHPAGLAQIEAAKADGRWHAAYDSPSSATLPDDFLHLLAQPENKTAHAFLQSLNKANRYAIAYRLQTAKKPETRHRRITAILAMLNNQKKFH